MKNRIIYTVSLLLLCTLMLFSCEKGPESYHTNDNIAASATVGENRLYAYFYRLEDGSAVLDLCKKDGETLQSFKFEKEGEYYASLDFEFAFEGTVFQDMNFDGEKDLYVPCSVTTPNLEGMAWLWDSDKGEFVLSPELSELYELTVFPDDELITSQDYANDDGILCREFMWKSGKLVKTGEYTIEN